MGTEYKLTVFTIAPFQGGTNKFCNYIFIFTLRCFRIKPGSTIKKEEAFYESRQGYSQCERR